MDHHSGPRRGRGCRRDNAAHVKDSRAYARTFRFVAQIVSEDLCRRISQLKELSPELVDPTEANMAVLCREILCWRRNSSGNTHPGNEKSMA